MLDGNWCACLNLQPLTIIQVRCHGSDYAIRRIGHCCARRSTISSEQHRDGNWSDAGWIEHSETLDRCISICNPAAETVDGHCTELRKGSSNAALKQEEVLH